MGALRDKGFGAARHVARQPAIRRVAQPAAAAYYGWRNKGRSAEERWSAGAGFEAAHWDAGWFRDAEERGLLDPRMPMDEPVLIRLVDEVDPAADPVTILDVGAGPLTPVGKVHPRRQVAITACDALAAEYDANLERAGITPPVRTVHAEGERLLDTFGAASFDIVLCGNALDHHYDPIAALEGMLAVTRPGGYVLLNHYVDEGEYQAYLGMHQWNIDEADGRVVIWNRSERHDVNAIVGDRAEITTERGFDQGRVKLLTTLARR